MIITVPKVIMNGSKPLNPKKSYALLYQPEPSNSGSDASEINGIIADIPTVSMIE
jgi:hypothetical protein